MDVRSKSNSVMLAGTMLILTLSAMAFSVGTPAVAAADPQPTPDPVWAIRMLSEHNALRQKYGVKPLMWDDVLAKGAQAWAEQIALRGTTPPEHRNSETMGENIVWGSAGAFTPQFLIDRWGREVANFDLATGTCRRENACLHFTQVVWSTTTKVGCGKARTPDGKTDFVVCDYTPPGNIGQQPPFKPIMLPSGARSGLDNDNLTIVSPVYNDVPVSTGVPATPGPPASEGTRVITTSKLPPTPTPAAKAECDVCSAVQQLAAKVDQLKPADGRSAPKNNGTVAKTTLLFPLVTNQAGFDTGISIANTSADTLGTKPVAGNCELSYFGNTTGGGAAPAKQQTTTALQGGQTMVFTLSSGGTNGIVGTPGFQGYMIATCNFPFARGYAFTSDVGAQKLATGYLAEIVPDPRVP